MSETISTLVIATGILFNLFGCIGLIRLPDAYNRLQSATKCATLGTCSILLGVLIRYGWVDIGVKALIAIPLLFFTATVAAHALAKAAYRAGVKLGDKSIHDDYKEIQDEVS